MVSPFLLTLPGLLTPLHARSGACSRLEPGKEPELPWHQPQELSRSIPVVPGGVWAAAGGQLCQAGSPWLPGSCAAPTRLRFAALSKEDERRNFFPVGTNVSYVCRPGYENSSQISPSSTCLENLTWSQPAELCRSEYSCCPTPPKAALAAPKMLG
ncbi:hypothetical protein EK904_014674 [Melospiza melodia maxima]|nr:hypothetical protein EK904_014674 [Melospiza melodia maxima]